MRPSSPLLRLLTATIAAIFAAVAFCLPATAAPTTPAVAEAAELTVTPNPATLTSHDLGFSGVQLAGSGFQANDSLSVSLDGEPQGWFAPVDEAGGLSSSFVKTGVAPGDHLISFTSISGGLGGLATITVLADPLPEITLSKPTISSAELAVDGVKLTGKNFEKYCTANFTLNGKQFGYADCDENGAFSSENFSVKIDAGKYAVTFDDGYGHQASTELTVTGATPADPVVSFTPSVTSESEVFFHGVLATGHSFPASRTIQIIGNRSGLPIGTTSSDSAGNISFLLKGDDYPHADGIRFFIGALSAVGELTVSSSFSAGVSKDRISTSELAAQGISVQGTFFPVGAKVTVTLDGKNPQLATVDALRNLRFQFKQAGVAAGRHSIGLTWFKSVPAGYPADAAGSDHLDLPLTVTSSTTTTTTGTSNQPVSVTPGVVPMSSNEQLANSGTNPTPALLGLVLILVGIGAVLLSGRRRPAES